MVKRDFSHQSCYKTLDHFNDKTGRNEKKKKHYVVLPNCNRVFRPYFDILFILSLEILKNNVTYVQCSLALYFVVITSHQM